LDTSNGRRLKTTSKEKKLKPNTDANTNTDFIKRKVTETQT